MLVLTRKRHEVIKIGEDIVITVIETSRGSVKLGIKAPASVRVLRGELDHRPVTEAVAPPNTDHEETLNFPVYSAEDFLDEFTADDVADVEDQALVCLMK